MPEYSVSVNHLSKKFGKFTAVDKVSFQVNPGEIFGFLGANGAGKTTTIRMLCGLLKPTSGTGHVIGNDIFKESEKIKRHIGYMSQKFSLYPDLTLKENIYFYGRLFGLTTDQIEENMKNLNVDLQFSGLEDMLTADLPLGQKQIAALLGALIHDPPVIFLDEPTSGVDPLSRRRFWKIIRKFAERGKTVFVTTHFMEEAEYCHRISIMHMGKIVALDTPEELKRQTDTETIQDLFMKLIGEAA